MTKRTVRTLGLLLLAAPLVVVGCSDNNSNKDSGAGGTDANKKWDGGDAGGTVADASPGTDTTATQPDVGVPDTNVPIDTVVVTPDTALAPDLTPVIDTAAPDVAVGPDTSIAPDTAVPPVDATTAVDSQAVDTTPAIDSTPVATCTESPKFTGGDVTGNRTLTKVCSPYAINGGINVDRGATLTIEPGATLKFASGTYLYIYAGAIFNAVGTAAEPIVLTSSKSVPASGDWQGVQLQNSGNSVTLKYVTVDYAGYGSNAAVDITNGSADVENCIIHDNAAIGLDATGSLKGTKVLANTFYSNDDLPLVLSDGVQADATNTFHSGTLVNTKQFVSFADSISSTRTLDITEVPYLLASDLNIDKTASVTVNPGVTLAFASGTQLYIYAGATFTAVGTATSPVIFTSSKVVPAQGDWTGLDFENESSSITIKYATVQYAGYGSEYAVNATNSTFDLENCTIQHNLNGGVDGGGSTHSTLKNNTFSDNNADGTTIFNYTMVGATNATVSGNTP